MLDIIKELREFEVDIDIWDPQAYADEVKHEYGIDLVADPKKNNYDAVLLAVKHKEFVALGKNGLEEFATEDGIFYDIKEAL